MKGVCISDRFTLKNRRPICDKLTNWSSIFIKILEGFNPDWYDLISLGHYKFYDRVIKTI